MEKNIIIGGAGYIGTVLTEHLLSNKHKVRCIDNLAYEQHGVLKISVPHGFVLRNTNN